MKHQFISTIGDVLTIRKRAITVSEQIVPVLCYHRFLPGYNARNQGVLSVSPSTFESQMMQLNAHGFQSLTLDQYCSIAIGREVAPNNPILLTIDDGYADAVLIAEPIARKYNFSINLFILAGETGKQNHQLTARMTPLVRKNMIAYPDLWRTLNWAEIKRLKESGVGIGLHGYTHTPISSLSEEALKETLKLSVTQFVSHLGFRPEIFALPFGNPGSYSVKALNILRRVGFKVIFSTIPGRSSLPLDKLPVKRLVVEHHHNANAVLKMAFGAYDWLGHAKTHLPKLLGAPIPEVDIGGDKQ